jgi:homoserine dehydrogenase
MTLALAARPSASPVAAAPDHDPVTLLQLDATDAVSAAAAVYREARRRRSVVVVAAGGSEAVAGLAARLDQIGVIVSRPRPGDPWPGSGVAIVDGPLEAPRRAAVPTAGVIRIALAGCGVVGGGVLARLVNDPRYRIVGVLVRDPAKVRDTPLTPELAVTDPAALLAREPDVVIEALSDASTGLALIRAALARGIDVVTANKQAVSADPLGLKALARDSGARLSWSASVGGGTPLIETVRQARGQGRIVRIEAVLNGTCNFILNSLGEGAEFADALSAAQAAGFAEEDPAADLTGLDAAAKLAILIHEATDRVVPVSTVERQTLSDATALPSGRVRQLAVFETESTAPGVSYRALDDDPLFAGLADEANAVRVTLDDGRCLTARGRGAGRIPTVESVLADLSDLGNG